MGQRDENTGPVGHSFTAALLPVAFTPLVARLVGLTGFYNLL